jgi:hypothetical protein
VPRPRSLSRPTHSPAVSVSHRRQTPASRASRSAAARPRFDHPGYYEGMLVSGARVFASGAMFAGLALALGGGHLSIAAIAALPYLARTSHLAVPELVRRHGSGTVAGIAVWLERGGIFLAALAAIIRPHGWAIPGLLAGFAIGVLGQAFYDASLAALHTEASSPATFGRYIAIKTRWASLSGLVLGVLASVAVDSSEHFGVPPHIARGLAIATGVAVHLLVALPLGRMRAIAQEKGRAHLAPAAPSERKPWLLLPRTPEQWAVVKFALAWGFAFGICNRQGEAMAISVLGVSVGSITMLNALLLGAGIIGAKTWGRLADRFGGKGLLSIALLAQALDPVWTLGAMLVHPALLIPGYAIWGVFNSGWNIAQSTTLVRTSGPAADRIRALVIYNVAFGFAAGTAPLLGGAILEFLDTRYATTVSYGALFVFATVLRLSSFRFLRNLPAPPSQPGRYVSKVVFRAARHRAIARTRAVCRFGLSMGTTITSTLETTIESTLDTTRDLGARTINRMAEIEWSAALPRHRSIVPLGRRLNATVDAYAADQTTGQG